jgi:hypothetical protein
MYKMLPHLFTPSLSQTKHSPTLHTSSSSSLPLLLLSLKMASSSSPFVLRLLLLFSLFSLCSFTFAQTFDGTWTLHGAFDPQRGQNEDRMNALTQWAGKQPGRSLFFPATCRSFFLFFLLSVLCTYISPSFFSALQLIFTTFDVQDGDWLWTGLENSWNLGYTPLVSLEPQFLLASTPNNILVLVRDQFHLFSLFCPLTLLVEADHPFFLLRCLDCQWAI